MAYRQVLAFALSAILLLQIVSFGGISNSLIPQAQAQATEIDAIGCIGEYEYWELLGTTNFYKTYGQDERNRLCVSLFETGKVPQELEGSYENSEAGIQIDIPKKWIGYEIQMDETTWIFLHPEEYDPEKPTVRMFFSIMDISKSNNLDEELSDLALRNVIDEPSQYNYCRVNSGKIVPDMNAYEMYIECNQPTGGWFVDIITYGYLTDRNIITATWVGRFLPEFDFDKSKAKAFFDILSIEKQRDISNLFDTPKPAQPIVKTKIPDWIRNNAGWWAEGAIADKDFANGIEYLIKEKIMHVPASSFVVPQETENKDETEHGYLKTDAKEYFVSGNNLINVKVEGKYFDHENWTGKKRLELINPNGNIDDIEISPPWSGEFQKTIPLSGYSELGDYKLTGMLPSKHIGEITFTLKSEKEGSIPTNVVTTEQKIPDWIKNNAEWWSQGLISDDDFVKGIQYLVEQGIIKV